ncbi:GumC family protein [Novosphingopyxis sp.]|uniref:GumC family protein n=1 Tax=Novosphingopyxis sp. TaxID=2709690 RepID=UPI003B5C2D84
MERVVDYPNMGARRLEPVGMIDDVGDETSESPILVQITQTLRRHKWVIIATGIAGLLCGLALTLVTPPTYSATTRLQINPEPTEVINVGDVEKAPQRDIASDQTAIGLLQSRSLAERVARSLNLANDPEVVNQELARNTRARAAQGVVRGGTSVEPLRESRLVDVSFASGNPQLAARVANSLAENFIQANLDRRFEQSAFVRDYLQDRLKAIRDTLENSERALVDFERNQGIVTIQSESGGNPTSQTINNAQLASVAAALAEAENKRIATEQRYRQFSPLAQSGQTGDRALQTQISQLKADRAQKAEVFKDDYPEIVELDQQIAVLSSEARRGNQGNAQTYAAEYRAALGEEKALREKLNELRTSVLNERADSGQFTILSREVDTNRALYDALLQRYKEVGVAGGVGENEVAIVDRATAPGSPVSPILSLNLGVGLAFGLLAGLLGSFAYDMLREFVVGPDDVKNRLGLKALGVIPIIADDTTPRLELDDPKSPVTEAYLAVANLLQFSSNEGVPPALLLTSTLPEEGKSSSSYGLARSFVRMGMRVVLMDADLRRPTFKSGQNEQKGVTHLLTGHATVDEVIVEGASGVSLIPAGGTPPNPSELFAGGKIRSVLSELRQRFDVIIIDAPPILEFVDAPALAGIADGTVVVIESGKVHVPHARNSIRKLKSAGANVVGAVITKYKQGTEGYGYGYSYDYKYEQSDADGAIENERRIIV